MPEPAAPPRLTKFVRRALREQPDLTCEALLERWRAQPHGTVGDDEIVQAVYAHEIAALTGPRAREPDQSGLVIASSVIWIFANIGLVLLLTLPSYLACRQGGQTSSFGSCGLVVGTFFLGVGFGQLFYGLIVALIALRFRKAIAQGILIGMGAAVVLFTVFCFGATITG